MTSTCRKSLPAPAALPRIAARRSMAAHRRCRPARFEHRVPQGPLPEQPESLIA